MYRLFFKRLFDFTISLLALIITSPILLLITLAIIIESKGNPIFKQDRVGKNVIIFKIYKFRTMFINSEKNGPLQTAKNDSRITKIGKILRKTSLDELPQLVNILKGQMALIGPRPDILPSEVTKDFRQRSSVLPGVTGLSQVRGRSSLTPEERMGYDLEYVKNVSFHRDIEIIFRTVAVVLLRKNTN